MRVSTRSLNYLRHLPHQYVYQSNGWIHSGQWLIGSFDAPSAEVVRVCLPAACFSAQYWHVILCVSLYNFKATTESISLEFPSLIVAVLERLAVEYSWQLSSLSATQFTVEILKSYSVEWFAMMDRNNFIQCTKFHTGKTVLETLTGELNALT